MGTLRSRRGVIAALAALLGTGAAVLVSTVPHRLHRGPDVSIDTSRVNLATDPAHRALVERHSIERHDEFTLAFVEFDDQGDFWSRSQLARLEAALDQDAAAKGAIIISFAHGWKHDARVCDDNVACFREVLTSLYNLEQLRGIEADTTPRRIFGVFLGWRGLSISPPVLRELSFYGRKATAHRVGAGEVVELLTRLELRRDALNAGPAPRSKLVVVGHSFGGALVYSALNTIVKDRLARRRGAASDSVRGFGDLVVLVNPAFEASLYSGIHDLTRDGPPYSDRQPAVLLTTASETDQATGLWFPLGRWFSTIAQRTSSAEQRRALRTALGHFAPYRTHEMRRTPSRGSFLPDIAEVTSTARGGDECGCPYLKVQTLARDQLLPFADLVRPKALVTPDRLTAQDFGGVTLRTHAPEVDWFAPALVVRATDEIITEHNGIYNRLFLDFLRAFLAEMERRVTPPS